MFAARDNRILMVFIFAIDAKVSLYHMLVYTLSLQVLPCTFLVVHLLYTFCVNLFAPCCFLPFLVGLQSPMCYFLSNACISSFIPSFHGSMLNASWIDIGIL